MATTTPQVLRIACAPPSTDFILVQAKHRGPGAFDIDIVATEGTTPFVGRLRQTQYHLLRAETSHGSNEDWSNILSFFFLRNNPLPSKIADIIRREVVVVATINDPNSITIVFRKNISGITQRLGAIPLQRQDEQEIELFDWAGSLALDLSNWETEKGHLETTCLNQKGVIADLQQQLDEMVDAKNFHERIMLEKFQEKLHVMKRRIRDQERVIVQWKGGSKERVETALEEEDVRSEESSPRKPQRKVPRTRKRKAEDEKAEAARMDAKREAARTKKMEINRPLMRGRGSKEDVREEEEDGETASDGSWTMQTPPEIQSDEETTAEGEEQEDEDEAFGGAPTRATPPSKHKGKLLEKGSGNKKVTTPPPRRELPFERKDDGRGGGGEVEGDGDEWDLDDDEL
ncbi:MAG: endoplasmic reticulum retention protein [Watsoniomyces obsoletus]|nr:MAG: endoplasmic reticulum retention protein [Watsoniomyces obsoletus]